MVALTSVILAWFVPQQYGMPAAGAAMAASLVLGVRHPERRGRVGQNLGAIVALVTATMLLLHEGESATVPLSTEQQGQKPGGVVVVPRTAPALQLDQVTAPEQAVVPVVASPDPVSDGVPGEHEPSTNVGGIEFPDLGDGNPFAAVSMTKKEMDLFVKQTVEYLELQKDLQAKYRAGELTYDNVIEQMTAMTDGLTEKLVAVMGQDRFEILSEELIRYYTKFGMDIDRIKLDMDAWTQSEIGKVMSPDVADAPDEAVVPE